MRYKNGYERDYKTPKLILPVQAQLVRLRLTSMSIETYLQMVTSLGHMHNRLLLSKL